MNAGFLLRILMLSAILGLLVAALGTALAAAAEAPAPVGHEGYLAHDGDDDGDDDEDDDSDGDSDGDVRADGGDGTAPPPGDAAPPAPVVAPPPPAATRTPPFTAAQLIRPGLLNPSQGRRLTTRRPVLRWRDRGEAVLVYNLQIFNRGKKVLSVFPRGGTYRVPAGRLAFDRRYVWRVWPYMKKGGYAARPLAMSWFVTPRR